jgi:nitrate reductase gamma subunit
VYFRNKLIFYGEELLASRRTPSLEVYSMSAVRDCFFSILAATPILEGVSSIYLRTRHAVVTRAHLTWSTE